MEVAGKIYPTEYVMCEDVTTLASSIKKCLYLLQSEYIFLPNKPFVKNTVAIVDRQEGAVENLAALGITHHYFLTKQYLGIV